MKTLLTAIVLLAITTPVLAQYAGSDPTGGSRVYGGGYTITTPGGSTTYVRPNPLGGGYTATTPGTYGPSTSYIRPNPLGGGYTITTPGRDY
jgi:hypothetical protein